MSEKLGLKKPIVMNASNIRMDFPVQNPNKFEWHQDFPYLMGSSNAVTYWLPLQAVSAEMGSIEIISGSHRAGLASYNVSADSARSKSAQLSPQDLVLADQSKLKGAPVEMGYGQGIVFSTFLLHRSIVHVGNSIRWTVQVRHSDAHDEFFIKNNCPMGDRTTILRENLTGLSAL